jgi:hypothetical protein
VVDESFLALTGFKTPALEGLARFFVPLTVLTTEMRTRLLLQTPYGFARLSPVTGGDGGESAAAESKVRKDFNPVAYFNPAVRTRPDGTAEVSFRLPDTMTAYRVYAVACDKGSGFASVQRELVVTKPFYLEPCLPAFLTRGDRFTLLVSSFNKTREPGKGTFAAGKDEFVDQESRADVDAFEGLVVQLEKIFFRALDGRPAEYARDVGPGADGLDERRVDGRAPQVRIPDRPGAGQIDADGNDGQDGEEARGKTQAEMDAEGSMTGRRDGPVQRKLLELIPGRARQERAGRGGAELAGEGLDLGT